MSQNIDPEKWLRDLSARFGGFRAPNIQNPTPLALGAVGILVLVWLATGFYTVAPSEQAALRMFGEFRGIEGPGLKWYPPPPIGTRSVEAVKVTRTMELGFRSSPPQDVPQEARMITGDLNIGDVQVVVQYRIADLEKFLFEVTDPGEQARQIAPGRVEGRTLKDSTEAALRQVVGQRAIDDVLTVQKVAVQDDTLRLLQEILDSYKSGLLILGVDLQVVRPPDPVRAAFDDVISARVDKESRINEALAYKQDRIPRARGVAEEVVQRAEGFRQSRIARARGEAARFDAVLAEYEKSKDVTRQRLYLEAMEETLPGVTKYIIESTSQGGDVLKLLNLGAGLFPTPTPTLVPTATPAS